MSEVQFVKTFLALLDRKAVKLNSDYVSDPRRYPAQSPYILPKPSTPFPRRAADASGAGKAPTITVVLNPMKSTSGPVTLASLDPNTSMLDVKTQYAQKTGQDVGKIKLLLNKRPASDLKALRELLPKPTPTTAEFSVMILGGGSAASEAASNVERVSSPAVQVPEVSTPGDQGQAQGQGQGQGTGEAPLSEQAAALDDVVMTDSAGEHVDDGITSDKFWSDLQDFLVQRLRNEEQGKRLVGLFKKAAQA